MPHEITWMEKHSHHTTLNCPVNIPGNGCFVHNSTYLVLELWNCSSSLFHIISNSIFHGKQCISLKSAWPSSGLIISITFQEIYRLCSYNCQPVVLPFTMCFPFTALCCCALVPLLFPFLTAILLYCWFLLEHPAHLPGMWKLVMQNKVYSMQLSPSHFLLAIRIIPSMGKLYLNKIK